MGTLPLIETEMTVSLICILVFSALVAAHRPPSTCLTLQYNQCKFPFRYRGRLFNECTTYNSENGKAWCTTQSGQYEDCQSSCPGVRPPLHMLMTTACAPASTHSEAWTLTSGILTSPAAGENNHSVMWSVTLTAGT